MNDFARSVEGAGGFAGDGAGFGVHRSEEILEGAAQQLGVERDVLFQRGVFFHGKFVVAEDAQEAAGFRRGGFAEEVGDFRHGAFVAEEEEVGNERLLGVSFCVFFGV